MDEFEMKNQVKASPVQCFPLLILFCMTLYGCGNSQPQNIEVDRKTISERNKSPVIKQSSFNKADEKHISEYIATKKNGISTLAQPASQPPQNGSSSKLIKFDENIVTAFEKLSQPVESFEEWEQANQSFLAYGEDTIPLLAHKLVNGDQVERELAASTLILMTPPPEKAIPALQQALQDSLPFVRANAATVLVQFPEHQKAAIPVLVKFLDHTDPNLQQMALVNLAPLGEEASPHVAELTTLLEKKSSEPEVLLPVVQLLGRIGPKADVALPKLKQIAFEQQGEVGDAANSAIELIETIVE